MSQIPWNKGLTKETDPRIAQYAAKNTGENNLMFGRTGEANPFYGKHHTELSKKKMRAAKRGEKLDIPPETEIRYCKRCSKEFEIEVKLKRKFCSPSCKTKYYWETKDNSERCKKIGKALDKKVWVNCAWCGKRKKVHRYYAKREYTFCSPECHGAWRSANFSGKNNPNYINGESNFPYPLEFNRTLKTWIKDRDNFICQLCGEPEDLVVHHINYIKEDLNDLNLITVCRSCNGKVNSKRDLWKDYFTYQLLHGVTI